MAAIWVRQNPLASRLSKRDSSRQHLPYDPVAGFAIFELAARRYDVAGAFAQAVARKISTPGIAEQHKTPVPGENPQPRDHPIGHCPLVADVAGGDDRPAVIDRVDQIRRRHLNGDRIERGIRNYRSGGEMIDLGSGDGCGTGFGGGDRDETRAGAEIERAASGYLVGVIEEVAGKRLAAGPSEGPVRRRQPAAGEAFLGRLPDRRDLGGEVETDFGYQRRHRNGGVAAYEEGGVQSGRVRRNDRRRSRRASASRPRGSSGIWRGNRPGRRSPPAPLAKPAAELWRPSRPRIKRRAQPQHQPPPIGGGLRRKRRRATGGCGTRARSPRISRRFGYHLPYPDARKSCRNRPSRKRPRDKGEREAGRGCR